MSSTKGLVRSEFVRARAIEVCREHHVGIDEVFSRNRMAPVSRARHELWFELRELGWSYPYIASHFGRDHTTIMDGVKKAAAQKHESLSVRHNAEASAPPIRLRSL